MKLPVNYSKLHWSERRKVREEYVKQQGGVCQCCKVSLQGPPPRGILEKPIDWDLFPKGFQDHPIHLHHDHSTGMTIGAVHARCNAYLWVYHGE